MNEFKLLRYKDFDRQMQRFSQMGGRPQKIAEKVKAIAWSAGVDGRAGLANYPTTNHGESRIKNCVKYQLDDFNRLVTVQSGEVCILCFFGTHDEVDRWLENNRGRRFSVDSCGRFESVLVSDSITAPAIRVQAPTDYAAGRLIDRMRSEDLDPLTRGVSLSVLKLVMALDTASHDDEIVKAVEGVNDKPQAEALLDVLLCLREGDVDGALRRRAVFVGEATLLEDAEPEQLIELRDGATVKLVPLDSAEYRAWVERLMGSPAFQDWMLFTHPEQQAIVDRDFDGPARLSGVSGSGKTSILVKRAVRLAQAVPGEQVLVVTLNRSLAILIQMLVDYASPNDEVRQQIKVTALFDLCYELLHDCEPGSKTIFKDVTWKNGEHIDEIWREYYRCQANNHDASVFLAIHKSLNAIGVSGERYLREELDWLRSACVVPSREAYKNGLERQGRAIPFMKQWRAQVLDGLRLWEQKMLAIGVTDQLGLATRLVRFVGNLQPRYAAALVDEMQDFGTLELKIVRALVARGKNDLFLCGDLAQRVQVKHQSMKKAGIELSEGSLKIRRNYRNGREVLSAAHYVLSRSVGDLSTLQGEVELLDPEFSNFSVPVPVVLEASSFEDEIAAALAFANDEAEQGRTNCIAFAGYSLRDIQKFGERLGVPVLDGTKGPEAGQVFMSDLEETKGYEFDNMLILNCSASGMPATDMPAAERFREACRLYVSMTRTKRQLLLSHCGEMSPWLAGAAPHVSYGRWVDHVDQSVMERVGVPERMPQSEDAREVGAMTGRQALYTPEALGLSVELQDKMAQLIDGRGRRQHSGPARSWADVRSAVLDVRREPTAKQLFGVQKTYKEFLERFGVLAG